MGITTGGIVIEEESFGREMKGVLFGNSSKRYLWILLAGFIWGGQPCVADEIEVRRAPKRVAKNWKHIQPEYLYYAPARGER